MILELGQKKELEIWKRQEERLGEIKGKKSCTKEDDGGISQETEGHTQSSLHTTTVGPHSVVSYLQITETHTRQTLTIHQYLGKPLGKRVWNQD